MKRRSQLGEEMNNTDAQNERKKKAKNNLGHIRSAGKTGNSIRISRVFMTEGEQGVCNLFQRYNIDYCGRLVECKLNAQLHVYH